MKYISDYDSIELKTKLKNLIEIQSEDNLSTHFQNAISWRTNTISGNITQKDFAIWHYDHFWFGLIYSVVKGKINDAGKDCVIELQTKLNSFGLVIVGIVSFMLGYSILSGIVIQDNNSFKFVALRLIAGAVLFLLIQSGFFFAYYSSKKETVKMLTENLKLRQNVC